MDKVDIVVIGAGAVGLAIGAAVADKDTELYILEKEEVYGQGTSSRNSEVIHAGIYYPKNSLKGSWSCLGGLLRKNSVRIIWRFLRIWPWSPLWGRDFQPAPTS